MDSSAVTSSLDYKMANHTHAGSGAPDDADYLVGTASGDLSAEIVVGTSPGGELGGTWGTPTVDATHAGSSHADAQAAAESTAATALSTHESDTSSVHGITDTTVLATDTEVATAVSNHEGEADPHTGYRLESDDHTHQSTGAAAGKLDHGAALDGLTDDDHTQYTKEICTTFSQAGSLATGTGTFRWYAKGAWAITEVRASVGTAPTGAALIVDVNKNGTTIFTTQSNRPEIAISGNTDTGTLDVTAIADDDYLTVDIDQVGSSEPGENLTVQVWMERA